MGDFRKVDVHVTKSVLNADLQETRRRSEDGQIRPLGSRDEGSADQD